MSNTTQISQNIFKQLLTMFQLVAKFPLSRPKTGQGTRLLSKDTHKQLLTQQTLAAIKEAINTIQQVFHAEKNRKKLSAKAGNSDSYRSSSQSLLRNNSMAQVALLEQNPEIIDLQDYQNLQRMLQSYEMKNRKLIKNNISLDLYCEQIKKKLAQSERSGQQLYKSTKQTILGLKRQNQKLLEKIKELSIILKINNADVNLLAKDEHQLKKQRVKLNSLNDNTNSQKMRSNSSIRARDSQIQI